VTQEEEQEFTIPPQIIQEVLAYAEGKGKLTEDYYELKHGKWVKLRHKPDMDEDHRPETNDVLVNDSSSPVQNIPDFVVQVCDNPGHTALFKKILHDPLSNQAADEYKKTVDPQIAEKAKEREFEEDATLPLSKIREIVMSCAFLQHGINTVETLPDKGAGLRQDGKPLPDIREMYNTWVNSFNELMDNRGYPSSWKECLGEAVQTLALRNGEAQPFTNEDIRHVSSQQLLEAREQAGKSLAVATVQKSTKQTSTNMPSSTLDTTRTAAKTTKKPSRLLQSVHKARMLTGEGSLKPPRESPLRRPGHAKPSTSKAHSNNNNDEASDVEMGEAGPTEDPLPDTQQDLQSSEPTSREEVVLPPGTDVGVEGATEPAQADVFADAENKTGQIGGFRVAGRTRDGTPTSHQVLVNVGTYGQGIVLWHIKNADQYRESIVEEYKANKGTEVVPSTSSVGDLRKYPLTGVEISGVAYIERTSGKDLKKMPMMFIQAKTGDDAEPTFWSRSFMSKVWGERAATLKIRRLMQEAKMPMPIVPEGASERTCTLWGVDFAGTSDTFGKGDVVIPGNGGSLAPGSQDSIRLDKARRIEELKAQLAGLEGTT
jgi:hypothetical protein